MYAELTLHNIRTQTQTQMQTQQKQKEIDNLGIHSGHSPHSQNSTSNVSTPTPAHKNTICIPGSIADPWVSSHQQELLEAFLCFLFPFLLPLIGPPGKRKQDTSIHC